MHLRLRAYIEGEDNLPSHVGLSGDRPHPRGQRSSRLSPRAWQRYRPAARECRQAFRQCPKLSWSLFVHPLFEFVEALMQARVRIVRVLVNRPLRRLTSDTLVVNLLGHTTASFVDPTDARLDSF